MVGSNCGGRCGGILGIIGGVAGSIVARKSSLETVELSSRLANEHAQHEKLELRAQEIMAKFAHLTKTRHSFMESMARYAAGESAAPNVMVLNEPLVDLEYSVSSSFPELSSLVRGFGIEMMDVFQKLSNLCGEIGAGKEFKGADFLPITGRSLAMEVAIREYISSKYIRNLDVEVPTIDMIDQMNSDG